MRAKLYQAFSPLASPSGMVFADQNAPRPDKPYVTLKVASVTHPRFPVEYMPDEEGIAKISDHSQWEVELMFFGPGAETDATRVASQLKYPSHVQRIHELGLSISTVGVPTFIPRHYGHQIEEQASLEITGYAIYLGEDDVGLIEEVEVEGTLVEADGDTITEIFNIVLPPPPVPVDPTMSILAENGDILLAEDGSVILREFGTSSPAMSVTLENGSPLLTEVGDVILQEG